jgi:hypothetical protein
MAAQAAEDGRADAYSVQFDPPSEDTAHLVDEGTMATSLPFPEPNTEYPEEGIVMLPQFAPLSVERAACAVPEATAKKTPVL